MTINVYRSHASIERGDYTCAEWIDLDFAPRPREDRSTRGGYRYRRSAPEAIPIEVPMGARLVDRAIEHPHMATHVALFLAVYFCPAGIPAVEALAHAEAGRHNFKLSEGGGEVARKKDAGPTLFGDGPDPAASAYPKSGLGGPRPPDPAAERARLAAIAAELVAAERADVLRRAGAIEDAARRALAEIRAAIGDDDQGGERHRLMTARAILEELLEPAPAGAGQAVA